MSKISTKNIALAIHESTKGKADGALHKSVADVVEYLAKKRLLSKAPDILKQLEQIIDKEEGIVQTKITYKKTPPKRITEEIEEKLKKRYKAKEIVTTIEEDTNVLGGVKIEVGDEIIDLTLRNKIGQLENYLITH